MKCLLKYQWVKLPRNQLPPGKGIMGSWARLASRAAFRTGQARYCGYTNKVSAGGWAGGIVGLKSILAIKRRRQALEHMDTLADLGYITYSLDTKTKKDALASPVWAVRRFMRQRGMDSSACPETSRRGLQSGIINLLRQTHGSTSGATQFGRSPAMRFPSRRRLFSLGSTALF